MLAISSALLFISLVGSSLSVYGHSVFVKCLALIEWLIYCGDQGITNGSRLLHVAFKNAWEQGCDSELDATIKAEPIKDKQKTNLNSL